MGKRPAITRLLAASFLLFSSLACANDQNTEQTAKPVKPVQLLLGAGLTFGGDDLLKARFDNGTSETIEAGGLIDLKIGALFNLPSQIASVQTTVGYFFDSINAENGDASFARIPLELIGFYHHNKHRFGLGVTYHTNVEFEADLPGARGDVDLDDSLGGVIEYGYQYNPQLKFSLRAVQIDYKVDDSPRIEGDHVGLYVSLTL
ncbi:MAG: hypothetical protein R3183_13190 [Oleiphilaceae bacterium]|nr:hypothetical protein [Oleiphilaceae bacterium]